MIFTTPRLRRIAERYLAFPSSSGWTERSLSVAIAGEGNPMLIKRILSGKGAIRLNNAELASNWFVRHWPQGLPWPEDIPHPDDVQNGHSRTGELDIVGAKVHKTTI